MKALARRMDPDRIQTLIASVELVFRGIPRPLCTKRVAEALDDEWFLSPERYAELYAKDPETDWRDIPDDDIEQFASTLVWMDARAFRFYYPAFLRYALRHWNISHQRVTMEVTDTLWLKPELVEELALMETDLLISILSELEATPESADSMINWAITLGAVAALTVYYGAYEYIHWCMHLPKSRRIEKSWVFRRLNGHHLLHHRYMNRNYNVVFPFADLCLGTLMVRSKCHFAQPVCPAMPNVQPKATPQPA